MLEALLISWPKTMVFFRPMVRINSLQAHAKLLMSLKLKSFL